MNANILTEDLEVLSSLPFIKFRNLENKTFLITGATGMIGFNLINALIFISKKYDLNIGIYCLVRNYEKVKYLFSAEVIKYERIVFFDVDIDTALGMIHTKFNYIIHLASPTSSKTFVEIPVEIIDFAYSTTKKLLEVARDQKSKFIYFSSMEVYGTPSDDRKISEDYTDNAPLTMSVRSSYCEAKRLCETLCKSYYEEYNVPIFVLRLTQTFGPGVNIEKDNRIFAQFAKSIVNKTIYNRLHDKDKLSDFVKLFNKIYTDAGYHKVTLYWLDRNTMGVSNDKFTENIKDFKQFAKENNLADVDYKLLKPGEVPKAAVKYSVWTRYNPTDTEQANYLKLRKALLDDKKNFKIKRKFVFID